MAVEKSVCDVEKAVCDGHCIIPPESIYELLGLQYTNYKPFTTVFFKRKGIGT